MKYLLAAAAVLSLALPAVGANVTYKATASAKTIKVAARVPLVINCYDLTSQATVTYTREGGGETFCAVSNPFTIRVCAVQPVVVSYTVENTTRSQTLK